MTEYPLEGVARLDPTPEPAIIPLEQAWNEFRSTFMTVVPADEAELATFVAVAIRSCSDEVEAGESFQAEADGRMVKVERHCRRSYRLCQPGRRLQQGTAGGCAWSADRRSG